MSNDDGKQCEADRSGVALLSRLVALFPPLIRLSEDPRRKFGVFVFQVGMLVWWRYRPDRHHTNLATSTTTSDARPAPPPPPHKVSMRRNRPTRSIFVTVGTTKFDSLVEAISDPQFLAHMSQDDCGAYTSLTVQYGRGSVVPFADSKNGLDGAVDDANYSVHVNGMRCDAYQFKPSLRQDMEDADLIISHAGAGSIMEGMELCAAANASIKSSTGRGNRWQKKLVVVTNAALMHGHQSELADALEARGHLFVVRDPRELLQEDTLKRIEAFDQVPFEGGDGGKDFAALVDAHFGFEA